MRFATKAIRVGQDPDTAYQAAVNPIYQSSTFVWNSLNESDIPPIDYTRCANPNRSILQELIASLENGKYCTCFASGMAAIASAISTLKQGDDFLMASDIYGGTHRLMYKQMSQYGITTTEFDASDPSSIARVAKPNSKMLIFETPTNPTLRVSDIAAIVAEAKKLGIVTILDNTFASPYLQNGLDLGVDIVIHSTTKYIAGHSDIVGGALITNDPVIANNVHEYVKIVGNQPSPFDCWLTVRGAKTLELRMQKHCSNALAIAQYLEKHPKIAKVYYPGLESSPDHAIAKKQMRAFGGMLSIDIKGTIQDAKTVAESVKVFLLAESLGGVESLVAYPPLMSHAVMSEEERLKIGIPPTMLRLSIGIEDPADLIEDLEQALAKIPLRETANV